MRFEDFNLCEGRLIGTCMRGNHQSGLLMSQCRCCNDFFMFRAQLFVSVHCYFYKSGFYPTAFDSMNMFINPDPGKFCRTQLIEFFGNIMVAMSPVVTGIGQDLQS